MLPHSVTRTFLYLTILAFFVIALVAMGTTAMSNNQTNGGVFGSFDSTGSAIMLIGFPWLALQYLKYIRVDV